MRWSLAFAGRACVFATSVEFSVAAPVVGVECTTSPTLDALVARWRDDPEVSSAAVEWKSLPRAGDALIGVAELRVGLCADTRLGLQKAYNRLTRQVTGDSTLRLSGRSCVLSEMFE